MGFVYSLIEVGIWQRGWEVSVSAFLKKHLISMVGWIMTTQLSVSNSLEPANATL